MNLETSKRESSIREDVVITTIGGSSLIGGILVLYLCMPSLISAFLLSLGSAAFVHRFLGGIIAEYKRNGIKVFGSIVAISIGTVLYNSILEGQLEKPRFTPERCQKFYPDTSIWIPVNRSTGQPINVMFRGTSNSIHGENLKPEEINKAWSKNELTLSTSDEDEINVDNGDYRIGKFRSNDLNHVLDVRISKRNLKGVNEIKVGETRKIEGFPFSIELTCLSECSSVGKILFKLIDSSGRSIGESGNRTMDEDPTQEMYSFVYGNDIYTIVLQDVNTNPEAASFLIHRMDWDWHTLHENE